MIISQFLKRNFAGKRDWQEVFKVMKSKDLQPGLLYLAKLSFKFEGQIKCFPDKVIAQGVHHQQVVI